MTLMYNAIIHWKKLQNPDPMQRESRNIEKNNEYWDSLKEMRPVTCNSNKAISKAESASQNSAGDKQKTNAILNSISTEPVEDSHLLETVTSSGKSKKRRKKSSNPLIQLASAVPASGKDVGEENSRVTIGINHKDSSGERIAASVPRQDVQGATTSELRGLSVEEKQSDSVNEVGGNDNLTSSLVHKQKKNATLDSLASETLKNVLPATDSSNGKKKRKKKSSNPLNPAVTSVPSFEKDVEEESSRVTGGINWKDSSKEPHAAYVPGKGVQGVMTPELCGIYQKQKQCDSFHEVRENDKVSSSLDLDMCETEAGSVKSKNNASKEEAAVGVERMRNSKDSQFANLKIHQAVGVKELSNLEINIELSRPENGVLNDDDNFKTGQTDRVEGERESLLHNRDPKAVLSEKFKPPIQVETDMNAKEVIATSKFLDGTGHVEHRKSGKKERKKRKAEDSVEGTPIKSGIELVKSSEHDISSAEPHKTINSDHSNNKAKKEENTFFQTKGKEISKTKTVSTSLLATGREAGDVHGDEAQSLQKISKTQVNAENMDEKMRKKSKKKQNSTAKNLLDLQTKAQDVGHKDPTPSADNQREVEASCKMTNEKQGSGGKSQSSNSSTIQLQESLSKDECAEDILHPEKKLLKVSRSGMKTPRSTKSDKFTSIPEDVRRPSVVKDSDTSINSDRKSEAFAVSKSNMGNSKNIVHQSKLANEIQSGVAQGVGKAFVNDIGEVVNNSEQDKSLLAKLGAIFKDDSSGSSEDEDGMVKSDASTRTPSENSFSSDYSDGESNPNLNSPRNGSYDSKRKKGDRRSITKAFSSSGEKSLTLDTILRSSSRYKKAKLTASQSQLEDTESQPVDFVPDSQAAL
ncbi:hypothetical protein FH972_009271 [Carpinus fangiana]|uniref:Uncharacterized protein n=1 Tax=Carpinus fangiana TaxID=176857 RepID=A0A5N6R4S1_9ROSI|nr:hypothetical protein FH972_009271 [Carpinus fangiana]